MPGETQANAAAVDLAARAHTLDDLLARVAPLGVADVTIFESGFVRDLPFPEIVTEPGNALLEPNRAKRGVPDGPATRGFRFLLQRLPQRFQLGAFHQKPASGE